MAEKELTESIRTMTKTSNFIIKRPFGINPSFCVSLQGHANLAQEDDGLNMLQSEFAGSLLLYNITVEMSRKIIQDNK